MYLDTKRHASCTSLCGTVEKNSKWRLCKWVIQTLYITFFVYIKRKHFLWFVDIEIFFNENNYFKTAQHIEYRPKSQIKDQWGKNVKIICFERNYLIILFSHFRLNYFYKLIKQKTIGPIKLNIIYW